MDDSERQAYNWQLYDLFDRLNDKHFGGELKKIPAVVGISDDVRKEFGSGHLAGATLSDGDGNTAICLSEALFSKASRPDELERILLHEMVHVLLIENEDTRREHHSEVFATACNAIGEPLGYPPVYSSDDPRCLAGADDCKYWPPHQDGLYEWDGEEWLSIAATTSKI